MTDTDTTGTSDSAPVENAGPPVKPSAHPTSLRIWPAIALVIALWALRLSANFSDEPSITRVMAQMMGPAALALLIPVWWVFFSRAQWKEKLAGGIGIVLIAAITTAFQDKTVMGFGTVIFAIPWGATAFALGAILFRNQSPRRTATALVAGLVGFGYWSMIRTDAIHGDFKTVNRWRWEPTPEEQFLETLKARPSEPTVTTTDADTASFAAPEWPAFRGPERNGVAPNIVLEEDWRKHPPKEIWRIKVGPGWSSFSVAGKRLFTQEQRGPNEAVVCYNAETGEQVWVHEDESRFWETIAGAGPRGTPTLADGRLYALGANGLVNCLDPATGKLQWSSDMREDAGRQPPTWGFSSSPLIANGLVIVHAGGKEDKGLLAYDQETGELAWSAPAGDHTYSSPQLSTIDGKQCVLILTNQGLSFIELMDGSVLGNHEWIFEGYRVIQPMVLGGSKILLGTPMGPGTQCIEVTWDGSNFATEEQWTSRRMNPYYNDFVQQDGYVYGFDNRIFACIDVKDGSRQWKRGRYGHGQVLLLPKKKQLLLISEDGELALLSATPEKHVEHGRFPALESRTWNHPVLIGNRLYVRNAEEAACFELATVDVSEAEAQAASGD